MIKTSNISVIDTYMEFSCPGKKVQVFLFLSSREINAEFFFMLNPKN